MKLALNALKYEDIRQQIIQYLTEKNEFGGQFDFTNSNISYFIDTMAYITMLMSYNTSHVANNVFLDTTEIRKNAVSIAKQLGYKPKRPYSAKFQGKLIYKGVNFNSSNKLVVYARSPFIGSFGNMYTNLKPITLTYKGNPTQLEADYVVTQGTFSRFRIQNSNTISNFSFTVNSKMVDEDNFSLYVIPSNIADFIENDNLVNYIQYKWNQAIPFVVDDTGKFTSINDNSIYFMEEDIVKEGFPRIYFGNDIIGKIPSNQDTIICEYLETKGSAANNENLISLPPADILTGSSNTFLYYDITNLGEENKNIFAISNFDTTIFQNKYNKSFGGTDLESLEDIKFNAPKFYSFSGRCVSKNDYMYYLSSFSQIKSSNVIGGDQLFSDDPTKLGNIYVSVVPNFNDSEFLNMNSIYMNSEMENDIKHKLDQVSIISTKRLFFKPSYVLVDVRPFIELNPELAISDKNKIFQQVQTTLQQYALNTFNKLGVKFRESKMSSVVESIESIISSYLDLKYYIVINHETVANLISNTNDFIYLPTRIDKFNPSVTLNFVKTNTDIIQQEILEDVDWSVMSNEKIKLLNNQLLTLSPKLSSIYSKLIHPTLNREMYSRDYTDNIIGKMWFVDATLFSQSSNFTDRFGNDVEVSFEAQPQEGVYELKFSIIENSVLTAYTVADIYTVTNPYAVTISITNEYTAILLDKFYIDSSSFVFNGSPFNINQTSDSTFFIEMRAVTYTAQLALTGENDIFSLYKNAPNTVNEQIIDSANKPLWTFEHVAGGTYANIKYNGTTIAQFERSHNELNPSNKKFKGYLNDADSYYDITNQIYSEGDYFIVTDNFFIINNNDEYEFFNINDVIFKSNTVFKKAIVKKLITSDNPSNLITVHKQGDLFINNTLTPTSDYLMFDVTSDDSPIVDFTEVVEKNINTTLDSSQFLPRKLVNNEVIRISIPSNEHTDGYYVYYGDNATHKLQKNMYVRNSNTTTWSQIADKKVFDGDILVYSETNSTHVSGGWYLLGNINHPIVSPATIRIPNHAEPITTINNLDIVKGFMVIKKIDTSAITISTEQLEWFTNPPVDHILSSGDFVICVDSVNNKWTIFEDDLFTNYQDIINMNTSFPEDLKFGTVYTVKNSDVSIKNFKGMTQNEEFNNNDKIIYYDNDGWKKFNVLEITENYTDIPEHQAEIGDMVKISNLEGNFNNDTSVIDAPMYNSNFLFNYNDTLYYTGEKWIKVFPYNIYNDLTKNGATYIHRKVLNDLGYNSDFIVRNNSNDTYNVSLYDIYHNQELGDINYYTGKITLKTEISGNLNKIDEITDINDKKLSAIFQATNYTDVPIRMDRIQLKPITRTTTQEEETDFDSNFSHYIITTISTPESI